MSLAFERDACCDRAVAVLRAGVLAREVCGRGGRGEVAAVFERSFYLRIGDEFICIGEPAIGNGPTTLIIAAPVAELGVRQGRRAFVRNGCIAIGDLLLDLGNCETWRPPPWPEAPSPAALRATCAEIMSRSAAESPADSLARAAFAPDVGWAKRRRRVPTIDGHGGHGASRLSPPYGFVHDLIGLGPGLTPSGDDFCVGALAALDALRQTNKHAALGEAVLAAADRTSPLSASFLRAAAAGHVGENLHTMVAAIMTTEIDAALAQAARIGHTSGWDALAGAVVTLYRC